MDTWKYLSAVKMQFDLIFADPPYDLATPQYHEIIEKVFTNQLLDDQGLLIIEHSEQEDLRSTPDSANPENTAAMYSVFLSNKKGRPVSRILSSLIIYLDEALLLHSSRLPNYIGRAVLKRNLTWRCTA